VSATADLTAHEDTTAAPPPALELRSLRAGYGRSVVLRDVDITVPASSVVAVLGPNGAGKTTLLRVAAGDLPAMAGSVHLAGEDVTRLGPHRRARRGLCHVPEGRGIFPSLSVRENLRLFAPRGAGRAVERAIDAFPILGQRLSSPARSLSGGQQQMLAMARAYVADPSLVLVDEASMGLAPVVVDQVFGFLEDVVREGTSLLLVEQYVSRALQLADHVYILRNGRVTYSGAAEGLGDRDVFRHYVEGGEAAPEPPPPRSEP
jgi:branched-chain amino acid transport system ATP-binding protein